MEETTATFNVPKEKIAKLILDDLRKQFPQFVEPEWTADTNVDRRGATVTFSKANPDA